MFFSHETILLIVKWKSSVKEKLHWMSFMPSENVCSTCNSSSIIISVFLLFTSFILGACLGVNIKDDFLLSLTLNWDVVFFFVWKMNVLMILIRHEISFFDFTWKFIYDFGYRRNLKRKKKKKKKHFYLFIYLLLRCGYSALSTKMQRRNLETNKRQCSEETTNYLGSYWIVSLSFSGFIVHPFIIAHFFVCLHAISEFFVSLFLMFWYQWMLLCVNIYFFWFLYGFIEKW